MICIYFIILQLACISIQMYVTTFIPVNFVCSVLYTNRDKYYLNYNQFTAYAFKNYTFEENNLCKPIVRILYC